MIVGYSGLVIIARTGDSRLDKLACVNDLFVAVTDHVRADGWRIGFLGAADDTSPDELAHALAAQTAAPAIALSVFDSDCAWATAADPSGATVDFCLNEQIIAALTDDVDNYKPVNPKPLPGCCAGPPTPASPPAPNISKRRSGTAPARSATESSDSLRPSALRSAQDKDPHPPAAVAAGASDVWAPRVR